MSPRVVYLHGFASAPISRKAAFFFERLREQGRKLETPDLTSGDFEHLTVTGQLDVMEKLLRGDPVTLIGSSLGGYLAALYASSHPEVDRLVLLAPAFAFSERWQTMVGTGAFANWRKTGKLAVFHYGEGKQRNVGFQLYEDSLRWPAYPAFSQKALIFHGSQDTVVPVSASRIFVESHANATLTVFDSDHGLLDVLPAMWDEAKAFLALSHFDGGDGNP